MECIATAYLSSSSGSEDGEKGSHPTTAIKVTSTTSPRITHKKSRIPQASCAFSTPVQTWGKEIQGYVSKRKRKSQDVLDLTCTKEITPSSNVLSPYLISLCSPASKQPKFKSSLPKQRTRVLCNHTKPVLSLEWHPVDYRLLVSAGLDGKVTLWDVGMKEVITSYDFHGGAAVRDIEWVTGNTALTAGYDCTAVYVDMAYGKEIVRLKHEAFVSVIKPFTTAEAKLALTGDFDGRLQLWDLRCAKVTKTFKGAGGKILDVAFLPHQDTFVASSDIVRKNAFSQAMNVWDVESGVTLTHQLYFEPFTCPCLRVHSERREFLAQSNGNYVVLFSSKKPFKLNKCKRFQGHFVSGFNVGFDLSPDGSLLCSASSEGKVHFYDYASSRNIRTLELTDSACLSVAWSSRSPSSQVAVSNWKGNIYVLE